MQKELLQFIIQSTPKHFLTNIREGMRQAMTFANSDGERFPENERPKAYGLSRHQRLNGAFREATEQSGLHFTQGEKINQGECYVASNPFIIYGKANLQPNNKFPAPALYRRAIARINEALEPDTFDLFNPGPIKGPLEQVGCLILPVIPSRHEHHLAGIYIGVPYSNLKEWHMYESLDNVINAYDATFDPEGLSDQAFATLKKNLKRKEG